MPRSHSSLDPVIDDTVIPTDFRRVGPKLAMPEGNNSMNGSFLQRGYFVFRWRHNCHGFCPSSPPKIEEQTTADAPPTLSVELVR